MSSGNLRDSKEYLSRRGEDVKYIYSYKIMRFERFGKRIGFDVPIPLPPSLFGEGEKRQKSGVGSSLIFSSPCPLGKRFQLSEPEAVAHQGVLREKRLEAASARGKEAERKVRDKITQHPPYYP